MQREFKKQKQKRLATSTLPLVNRTNRATTPGLFWIIFGLLLDTLNCLKRINERGNGSSIDVTPSHDRYWVPFEANVKRVIIRASNITLSPQV